MGSHGRPAAEGVRPGHYPMSPVPRHHVAPAAKRVRGMVDGAWVFDTTSALYLWEHPYYPQYYIPDEDVFAEMLLDDGETATDGRGLHQRYSIRTAGGRRPGAGMQVVETEVDGILGWWRFVWSSIDHWFEEDEEIFVHPRSPYVRVDAIASSRPVRVEAGGVVLASTGSSVVVFETGLPPRYYLPKTAIDWSSLSPSGLVTACPYKGVTSGYWHVEVGGRTLTDVAWSYGFPTRQVLPIAGLVAFDDEQVDVVVEGAPASS